MSDIKQTKLPGTGKTITFRSYDLERDPDKIVKTLFSAATSTKIRRADHFFTEDPNHRKRFVAEIENDLHGTITVVRDHIPSTKYRATLYSVVVSPEYRGTQLASLLLAYCEKRVRELGVRMLFTSTMSDNIPTQKFFLKHHYTQYGELPVVEFNNNDPQHDSIIINHTLKEVLFYKLL